MSMKIGVDVGGVLHSKLESKQKNDKDYLSEDVNVSALETIRWIVNVFGRNNIFIISKCPAEKEVLILTWLRENQLISKDTFFEDHVLFCRERSDKAKIAKDLGIDCFIDDRSEVLEAMKGIVMYRIQFSSDNTLDTSDDRDIIHCNDWSSTHTELQRLKG